MAETVDNMKSVGSKLKSLILEREQRNLCDGGQEMMIKALNLLLLFKH